MNGRIVRLDFPPNRLFGPPRSVHRTTHFRPFEIPSMPGFRFTDSENLSETAGLEDVPAHILYHPLFETLSPAELRTAVYLMRSGSNREVARQLNLSVETIKTQARKVYRAAGVVNRTELKHVIMAGIEKRITAFEDPVIIEARLTVRCVNQKELADVLAFLSSFAPAVSVNLED
jgi:DNA-binding CsgD family transcriptional regulator